MSDMKKLFRGKRVDNGEWIEGDLVQHGNMDTAIVKMLDHVDGAEFNCVCWEVDGDTVGQFVGLEDKNGVKIFEGDILRADGWEELHEVTFADGAFCTSQENVEFYCNDMNLFYSSGGCSIAVVGSIHDEEA